MFFSCTETGKTNLSEHLKINSENEEWQTYRLNKNSVSTISLSLEEIEKIPNMNVKDYFLLINEIGKLKTNKPKLQEFMTLQDLSNLQHDYEEKIERGSFVFKLSYKQKPIGDCRTEKYQTVCYNIDLEELRIQPSSLLWDFNEEENFKKYHNKVIRELERKLQQYYYQREGINADTIGSGSMYYQEYPDFDFVFTSTNRKEWDRVFKIPLSKDKFFSLKDNLKIIKIFSLNIYSNYKQDKLIYKRIPYNPNEPYSRRYDLNLYADNPTLLFIDEKKKEIILRD